MNQSSHEQQQTVGDFTGLTPDIIVSGVEDATGTPLAGFAHPLNSYINRVYELQTMERERIIAKFYRPGRWTKNAILDEHDFVLECVKEEIPVVAPVELKNGSTIGEIEGIFFAVYPKKLGRIWEPNSDDDWKRLGRVIARTHLAGGIKVSKHRLRLHPAETTATDISQIIECGHIPNRYLKSFSDIANSILKFIIPLFNDCEFIRIHGDCHPRNILHRPDEGLILIDFDDMINGTPVQDMWMLLPPGRASESENELELMLRGYCEFRDFDKKSPILIEPLRAMRMLYFLDWIGRQKNDSSFKINFPDWSNESFWATQTKELDNQFRIIKEDVRYFS